MSRPWFKKSCKWMPDFFQEGSVQVDGYLKSLETRNCKATVSSICIYKTPLEEGPLRTIGTIMHHFLVVEVSAVSHPTEGVLGRLVILAEKAGPDRNGKNTGITVKHVPFVEKEGLVERHTVGDLDVIIPMAQLLKILTTHSPDYDLVNDNCWKYADATCRALLNEFENLRPEHGSHMRDHLQQMPPLVMPGELAVTVGRYGALIAAATCLTVCVYKSLSAFYRSEEEDDREESEELSEAGAGNVASAH